LFVVVFNLIAITPRRSQRIQKTRDPSPPLEESPNTTRGPRSMAKLKKSQRDLNKTAVETEIPKRKSLTLTRPSLPAQPENTEIVEKKSEAVS
jgi:hypothetical protein